HRTGLGGGVAAGLGVPRRTVLVVAADVAYSLQPFVPALLAHECLRDATRATATGEGAPPPAWGRAQGHGAIGHAPEMSSPRETDAPLGSSDNAHKPPENLRYSTLKPQRR